MKRMIQLVCHKKSIKEPETQDGPNRTEKPDSQTTRRREKCLQATLSYAVLHITRIKQSAGILGWKAGCPCSQVPDMQTGRQNAEKK